MDEAFVACHQFARSHQENFVVMSRLLPARWADDFAAIYTYCRRADDAADEAPSIDEALAGLEDLERRVESVYAGTLDGSDLHFEALADVIERHEIPKSLFLDLLDAFVQDQRVNRYESWTQLLDYCRRSADPVGRLVLYVTGHGDRDEAHPQWELSDSTCTALQLVNFWQDVRPDYLKRDRIYMPADIMSEHGVDETALKLMIEQRKATPACESLVADLVERTAPMFVRGRTLTEHLTADAVPVIRLFNDGGEAVIRGIRRQRYDVVRRRPPVTRLSKAWMVARAWIDLRRSRHRAS